MHTKESCVKHEREAITAYFIAFIHEWVRDFDHWRARGHLLIHVRNLGIAAMRFAEKMDEIAAKTDKAPNQTSFKTDWREIFGFFRRR